MRHRDKTIVVTEVLLQNKNDEGEKWDFNKWGQRKHI